MKLLFRHKASIHDMVKLNSPWEKNQTRFIKNRNHTAHAAWRCHFQTYLDPGTSQIGGKILKG